MIDLTGVYAAREDNASIYLTTKSTWVMWYAEIAGTGADGHRAARTAHVFFGSRSGDNDIRGNWINVPKGETRSSGRLALTRPPTSFGFPKLKIVSRTSPFLAEELGNGNVADKLDGAPMPAGFAANPGSEDDDLTGTWVSDSGTWCYVRQQLGDVVWFAEKGNAGGVTEWAYAFFGRRHPSEVSGRWASLPKGRTDLGDGNARLRIENAWTLRRTLVHGDLPDEIWHRVDSFRVDVVIDKLRVRKHNDTGITQYGSYPDEPLIWLGLFKQDGEGINLAGSRRGNHATLVMRPNQPNRMLVRWTDYRPGTGLFLRGFASKADVPESLGSFTTLLTTVRGIPPESDIARLASQLGVIAVAWDRDDSSDRAMRKAYRAFVRHFKDALDHRVRNLFSWLVPGGEAPLSPEAAADAAGALAESALVDEDSSLTNSSDYIDSGTVVATMRDFRGGAEKPIHITLRDPTAHYEVTGWMSPAFRGGLDPRRL